MAFDHFAGQGRKGADGSQGPAGATGAAGPNEITSATDTDFAAGLFGSDGSGNVVLTVVGGIGSQLIGENFADDALDTLGGTAVGKEIFTIIDDAALTTKLVDDCGMATQAYAAGVVSALDPQESLVGQFHNLSLDLAPWKWQRAMLLPYSSNTINGQFVGTDQPTVVGTATTPGSLGGASFTTAGAGFLVTQVTSAGTANATADWRNTTRFNWARSTLHAMFSVDVFRVATLPASGQGFYGYLNSSSALAWNANLQSLTECVGLAFESGDTNMSLMYNDSAGSVTKLDLGVNFPISTSAVYRLFLCCDKGSGTLSYQVDRLDTWATTSGVLTTNLPSQSTGLRVRRYQSNGPTASAATFHNLACAMYVGLGPIATPIIPPSATSQVASMNLPLTIPCVVGFESNIYFDGLLKSWYPPSQFNFDVVSSYGRQDSKRWRLTPVVGDVGSRSLDILLRNGGTDLQTKSTTLVIKNNTVGAGQTRKALAIGDSLTQPGSITQQVLDNLTADSSTYSVTFIGTQGSGSNKHEGRSGQTVSWFYTNASSPFVFSGSFNFAQYLSTNSLTMSSGDSVFIELGINDIASLSSDSAVTSLAATMITQLNAMITNMQSAVSGLNVWICTVPQCASSDAFGDDYLSGINRDRYNANCGLLRELFYEAFEGRSGSNVRLCPLHLVLDTENNYPTTTEALNARNATTIARQSNAVHPAASGYSQLGDLYYCCLMSLES